MHPRLPLVAAALLAGCSAADYSADEAYPSSTSGAWADTGLGIVDDDASFPTDTYTLPPEAESDFLALPPAQTDKYVFVANPDRDTVTRVNVRTLDVLTTEVGRDPDIALTTPDYRTAAVFNRGDDSVSIVDAGTLDVVDVPVRDDLNQMVMSPDGSWVTLFHDIANERPDDPAPQGIESFNEASFVHLPTGEHYPMAVGFNPRMVRYTPDSHLAVIVSDAYLAVVDLDDTPLLPQLIELAPGVLEPPSAEEVVLAPDGSFAFVRQFGTDEVLVVDLAARTVDAVPVGANPTDLDLSPGGAEAVVVARDAKELWILDTVDPFAAPRVLPLPKDLPLGSVLFDPTGDQAIVYTTAFLTDRYVTWDLASDTLTTRALVKPVTGMAITPTGDSLLAFHTYDDALGAAPSPFTDSWALTITSLSDFRTNPLKLPGEPIGYANSGDGRRGYFIMEDQPYLEVLDYVTMLPDEIVLRSNPVYVGVLPPLDDSSDEPPAWVSQDHELGRISFYDPESASLETITGFELNSAIE
jgi:DNA-binding beta-propeller fold protein YncE